MLMRLFISRKGIFNKEVATKFKDNVLSKGGTELPMELYVLEVKNQRQMHC
jgi:Zn-dependent oligopeptidase